MAFALRSEAAFVAHGRRHAAAVDDLLQSVEGFGAVAKGFAEGRSAHGNDHEFLQVEVVVRVRAAVDDVHHRDGHLQGAHAAEVAVERHPGLFGGGAGHGHGDGEDGVGAETALVVRPVEVDHRAVDVGLIGRFETEERIGDFARNVGDGVQHALAAVALRILVAQFDRFADARRGARGNGGAADGARFEPDFGFNGGIAAAVEHFTADDVNNRTHDVSC